MRHEEFHVTVEGDPFRWQGFCVSHGIKPLWIELNNFETQLMCASPTDPTEFIKAAGWPIVRVKQEVAPVSIDVTTHGVDPKDWPQILRTFPLAKGETALYHECHVKIDGPFISWMPMASRDLYRHNRWYVTKRQERPFDPDRFAKHVKFILDHEPGGCRIAEHEYEVCIVDSNKDIDKNWE